VPEELPDKSIMDMASESDGQVEFTWQFPKSRGLGKHLKHGEVHVSIPWWGVALGGVGALAGLWLLLQMLSEARTDRATTQELLKATVEQQTGSGTTELAGVESVYTYPSPLEGELVLVTATVRGVTKRSWATRLPDGTMRRPTGKEKRAARELGGVNWDDVA
jgi:hypothetical protein